MNGTQPQNIVAQTAAPQSAPVIIATTQSVQEEDTTTKSVIRKLGIAELVLGIVSVVCGAALLGTVYGGPRRRGILGNFAFGEGMWCGVWIIIAGSLGIAVGKRTSSVTLVNVHLGFAITAAVFSLFQLGTSIFTSLFQFTKITGFFFILLDLVSLASFILLIVSSVFCCRVSSACCSIYDRPAYHGQVVYVTGNTQQQVVIQGSLGGDPGYVNPGFQPDPGQQPGQTFRSKEEEASQSTCHPPSSSQ